MSYHQHLAGNGSRFANFIVDRIAFVGFVFLIGLASGVLGIGGFWVQLENNRLLDIVFSMILYAIFMFLQESIFKTSLGKLITGTKIISVNDHPLTTGQILARSFSRIIPFEPFSFLGSSVGWHDKISETRVVRKSFLPAFASEWGPI